MMTVQEKLEKTRFWPLMMFFAADRAGVDYTTYITDPEAMARAQQLMVEKYHVDAVSACSDSYHISCDLGFPITYMGNQTPHLTGYPVDEDTEVDSIQLQCEIGSPGSRTAQRIDAIALMKEYTPDVLISGWVEMPFAEVAEWFGVQNFMYLLVDDPDKAHAFLEKATNYEIEFALKQLAAGADVIGCGDAATSLVGPEFYEEFAFPYEKRVIDAIHKAGGLAKLHICGNTTHNILMMAETGADIMNVDSAVDLDYALRVCVPKGIIVKGNADPVRDLMEATPEHAHNCSQVMSVLARLYKCPYILSAGCEIPAAVSDEVLEAFRE